ncbi:hypothetical protein CIL03_01480 [Virgibacillus indicus]|uniref:Aminoglycoside phosphotransferase domain-containing protein n=1 Tax=Virgibacillus indicus TaxID=2024554 RepID=A0A265NDE9_9BACI|nr:hypothetical protein [Virgibacillus indicus]OZU89837.1 hypothetical protein CIL03_01480 [Virgibacillus indicus]
MNENKRRDELYRLSSFLYQEGKLEVDKISFIKPNVFRVATIKGENLVLKSHRRKDVMEQQWAFFERMNYSNAVSFKYFPNEKMFIADKNNYWTIAPYIRGEKLNYNRKTDRQKAVEALKNFHSKATGIYIQQPVYRELFIIRWIQRLSLFKKTEHLFAENGFKSLYKDIVQTMETQLRYLEQFPWHFFEKEALQKGSWIHGDSASHNFIKNSQVYMIDFDLLHCTNQLYDYIQLGQRFLSYLNWDLDELLSYRMAEEMELKPWLYAILIPSDLLREWLYFLKSDSSTPIEEYLSQMEQSLSNRASFLKKAKLVLKSIY